jgi:hypothetical protein
MTTAEHVDPVRVHITSANEGVMIPAPGRRLRNAVTLTKNMTAAIPIIDLVPYDTNRLYILVQAGGSNIVLCTDLSMAQDPVNQVPGVPNPNGLVLTAGNTMPLRIDGCQRMWAVGNTFPSQVTWIAIHEQVTR